MGIDTDEDEDEREEPSIEMRLRWGEDLLRVAHFTPPRSVRVGELAEDDLPLGRDLLGADRATIVVADGEGVRAIAPPGVKAIVERTGEPPAAASASQGAGGTSIPLVLGTRVILSFPAGGASVYRSAAAEAPVIVEVAMVRAGRVVGRNVGLGDTRRFIAACAVAAGAAAGVLWSPGQGPAPVDTGSLSVEQVQEIVRLLRLGAEPADDVPEEPRPISRSWRDGLHAANVSMIEEGPYGPSTLDIHPTLATLFCSSDFDTEGELGWIANHDSRGMYCAARVVTPFGLRGSWPWPAVPARDPLGRDPHDVWPFLHPRAARAASAVQVGRVRLGPVTISGPLESAVVTRAIGQNLGRVRLCYAEGLGRVPTLAGKVLLRLAIGRDGVVSVAGTGWSELSDKDVSRCLLDAFRGMAFPVPEGRIATVAQELVFTPR